ncbi:MAG: cytochrome c biogenesis protein CcsA [Burkholderiales bacterium]|nr:cytochrome c biogenesis protein CcsA [Burkholderiales bacterium]
MLLHAGVAALYAGLALHFWRTRWSFAARAAVAGRAGWRAWERVALACAVLAHCGLLAGEIFDTGGFRFGFAHALSAMALLALVFYGIESLFHTIDGVPALVLPPSAVCVLLPAVFPGAVSTVRATEPAFVAHVVVAMAAYAFIAIAAVHAILMLVIERRLQRPGRSPAPVGLPPLLTMENLLFRILAAGFALLTLTLASGLVFAEEIFGRTLRFDHKTVFSLLAWLIFAVLLLGRRAYGWRGRAALNGTFAGFAMLLLAYIGSRFVVEVVLGRA